MKRIALPFIIIVLVLMILPLLTIGQDVFGQTQKELDQKQKELNEIQKRKEEILAELSRIAGEKNNLTNTISQNEYEIQLTELEIGEIKSSINQLKDQLGSLVSGIDKVSTKIGRLEDSFGQLSGVFKKRVSASYIASYLSPLETLMKSRGNVLEFAYRYWYLKELQNQDKDLLETLISAKDSRNEEKLILETQKKAVEEVKSDLEGQQNQLEGHTQQLASQKASKEYLLFQTQNSEAEYQRLLRLAEQEQQAISAEINNLLTELIKQLNSGQLPDGVPVKQGDVIGYQGHTGCAFGSHLHFGIYSSSSGVDYHSGLNPLNYLGGADMIWPLSNPIVTQYYSVGHDALDIVDGQGGLQNTSSQEFCPAMCPWGVPSCEGGYLNGEGAPIFAVAKGVIVQSSTDAYGSHYIVLYHEALQLFSVYYHLM